MHASSHDPDDPAHVAPFAHLLAGIGGVLPRLVDSYRTGAGVPYHAYGRDLNHGQGHINRPAFTRELPTEWLAAMPDVVARLETARHARVADVGCGQGFSTIAVAQAFLDAHVDGLDADAGLDPADARGHARDAGLDGRVRFLQADTTELAGHGPYDLVLLLEALHDLSQPVEALRAARSALTPGGVVLVVVDEKVAETFTAPGDEVERMIYGWSVTHCLPTQLAEQPSAALGTAVHARGRRPRARCRRRVLPASTSCRSTTTSSACTGSIRDHRTKQERPAAGGGRQTRGASTMSARRAIHTITSPDGTEIAYQRSGDVPPSPRPRRDLGSRLLAAVLPALAARFRVYALERRGRGYSGDTQPYAIEREYEDIAALVDAIAEPVPPPRTNRTGCSSHSFQAALLSRRTSPRSWSTSHRSIRTAFTSRRSSSGGLETLLATG